MCPSHYSPLTLPIFPCPSPFPPACPITFSLSEVTALTCGQTGGRVSPPLCPRTGMFRFFSQVFTSGATPKGAASGCTAPKTQCEALSPATGPSECLTEPRGMETPHRILLRKQEWSPGVTQTGVPRNMKSVRALTWTGSPPTRGAKLSGILEISLFWDTRWLELRVSSG